MCARFLIDHCYKLRQVPNQNVNSNEHAVQPLLEIWIVPQSGRLPVWREEFGGHIINTEVIPAGGRAFRPRTLA